MKYSHHKKIHREVNRAKDLSAPRHDFIVCRGTMLSFTILASFFTIRLVIAYDEA
jgi:hypothetical protein